MFSISFQAYPATAKATFDCPSCGKLKRVRTFREECTVNPFNKREDGQQRTASEVRQQSVEKARAARDTFMKKPLCATCEGQLSYTERRALNEARRAA